MSYAIKVETTSDPLHGTRRFTNGALTNTAVNVMTTKGNVYGYRASNSANAAATFIQMFDLAAASVTLGATAPDEWIEIPPGGYAEFDYGGTPDGFFTALSVAATTTRTGSSAPTSAVTLEIFFRPVS